MPAVGLSQVHQLPDTAIARGGDTLEGREVQQPGWCNAAAFDPELSAMAVMHHLHAVGNDNDVSHSLRTCHAP